MRRCLLAVVLLLGAASSARADHDDLFWGQLGHRIIARVAAARLTPAARLAVRDLIPGETLASVASWADSIRPSRPETGPWHYVNIPIWDSIYRPKTVCPDGTCVIAMLEKEIAILRDRTKPRSERAEALKWVVHLMGDMHQPLHVGDRGDRGGNDVKLTWAGKAWTLHSLWDTGLLVATGVPEERFVVEIGRTLDQRGDLATLTRGSIVDWAMESHDVARDVAYPFLPTSLDVDPSYLAKVRVILEDRVLRASVRLAKVLNEALAKG
ncbi:MAG: S1/P1 nuclease [Gemmatimonadales bacterium]|nr:S1/P1 nuclease [Gemmatimonadales bacterium]MBP6571425.1 S1/P1 nuclease [Gemmatimonadales bacterium]MBP7621089.1 S1/P1 nuclease [Gemmatimonadales bacterium]